MRHKLCFPSTHNPLMKYSAYYSGKFLHLALFSFLLICVCKLSYVSLYMFCSIGSFWFPNGYIVPLPQRGVDDVNETTELDYDVEGMEEVPNLPWDILEALNREREGSKPNVEETEVINLADEGKTKKPIKIRVNFPKDMKDELIALLNKFKEIFAWSYQDVLVLHTEILVHRIPFKPKCP